MSALSAGSVSERERNVSLRSVPTRKLVVHVAVHVLHSVPAWLLLTRPRSSSVLELPLGDTATSTWRNQLCAVSKGL